jgi:hypothetical protein
LEQVGVEPLHGVWLTHAHDMHSCGVLPEHRSEPVKHGQVAASPESTEDASPPPASADPELLPLLDPELPPLETEPLLDPEPPLDPDPLPLLEPDPDPPSGAS